MPAFNPGGSVGTSRSATSRSGHTGFSSREGSGSHSNDNQALENELINQIVQGRGPSILANPNVRQQVNTDRENIRQQYLDDSGFDLGDVAEFFGANVVRDKFVPQGETQSDVNVTGGSLGINPLSVLATVLTGGLGKVGSFAAGRIVDALTPDLATIGFGSEADKTGFNTNYLDNLGSSLTSAINGAGDIFDLSKLFSGVTGPVPNYEGDNSEARDTIRSHVFQPQFQQGLANAPTEGPLGDFFGTLREDQIGEFNKSIDSVFTGNAFQPLDDDIVNSIVQSRIGPAQQQIANAQSRGNFNAAGSSGANTFLNDQTSEAFETVKRTGESVLSGNQRSINDIRDRARQEASGFQLGDDLFDVQPFAQERSQLIDSKNASLRGDIENALGSQPLFDVQGALHAGGRTQGSVSGAPTLLDAIAERQAVGGGGGSTQRGLGSRGSGSF